MTTRRGAGGTPASADQVGQRLRALRIERGLSLRKLATRLGISASALSQLETGQRAPSLERLHQIVAELDYPLAAVFDDAVAVPSSPHLRLATAHDVPGKPTELTGVFVQRGMQAPKAVLESDIEWRVATPLALSGLDILRISYPPGAVPAGPVSHPGIEVVHVVRGRLRFEVGEERSELGNGDSIMYDAQTPHRVGNWGKDEASAVWIVSDGTCQISPSQELQHSPSEAPSRPAAHTS